MTAGLALLLALRLATGQATAPPEREVDEVRTGTILTTGNLTLNVTGGAYMPDESFVATAKELAQLRAENAALKASPESAPTSVVLIVIAGVVGAVLGAGIVIAAKH